MGQGREKGEKGGDYKDDRQGQRKREKYSKSRKSESRRGEMDVHLKKEKGKYCTELM